MSRLIAVYMASLMLRSIGIAVIAGVFTWKIRNAAARHAVWVAVLGAMLLMPVVDSLLPASWIPARVQTIALSQAVEIRTIAVQYGSISNGGAPAARTADPLRVNVRSVDWWRVAAVIYFAVACALFSVLVVGYGEIWKLKRSGRIIAGSTWSEGAGLYRTRRRVPELRESNQVRVPITVGFRRPVVMLPAGWQAWDQWKLRAVLLHELAHVRRSDWAIAAIAAVAKCVFWLNPLSWFLERRLTELAEQCSDDASLARVENATRYAEVLLEFAAVAGNGGRFLKRGVAMAQHKMRARIERVLNDPRSGDGVLRFASWMTLVLLATPVLYSAAALHVGSKAAPVPVLRYTATRAQPAILEIQAPEIPQNPARPETRESTPQSSPAVAGTQGTAAALQDLFLIELEQTRRNHILGIQQNSPNAAGSLTGPANPAGTDLLNRESTLREQLPQQGIPANTKVPVVPFGNSLLNLPDNSRDLLDYLNGLAQIRSSNSFTVSFTGIQGRMISMKVAGLDFSFGCESCSFFVGESVVSSAETMPPGPGALVRLGSDGSDLSITCRATSCYVNIESDTASQTEIRHLTTGTSASFRTSNRLSVVISRY